MNQELKQHISNIINAYPPRMQEYIFSDTWIKEIESLKTTLSLTDENIAILKENFIGLILGIRYEDEVENNIKEEILDQTKQQSILYTFNSLLNDLKDLEEDTPTEKDVLKPSLADELLHVAGVKQHTAHMNPEEKTPDTELVDRVQEASAPPVEPLKQNTGRVENIGASKPIVNPFSDQTPVHEPEEKVTPDTQLPPIVKPVPIPPKAVVPPFETQAQAEKTEPLHVEQEYSPAIDSANKKSDADYRGNDPYREAIN